ncbi:DUF6233 domain-containing protein [Streptomyces sp. NBC_01426]|uniref:DUF6233 domain-containing protein n=1 Tax=Streptomyces sp. NBC_01426 TaxID=2975866 RepID=UPI003FCC3EE5
MRRPPRRRRAGAARPPRSPAPLLSGGPFRGPGPGRRVSEPDAVAGHVDGDPLAVGIGAGRPAGRPLIRVHVGGCRGTHKRCSAIDVEQTRRALAEGVPGCPHCRPHITLGVLD